ncbi:MAG: transcriptional repressor, partial [Candidatus Saccharimonas sp.]|nr:transcriptional repressor [Planctomycetaceae bacterium]
ECIPWGWTDDVRRLCDKHGWLRNDPPDEAVRAANSRRFSAALEREWLCGLDFAGEATSLQEIDHLIAFHDPGSRWVVKAEFGMSGRERILGCGSPTEADRNWIEKRLASDGVVYFEPWVERLDEVGIQIDLPRDGDPQLIAVVRMLVDERGQYAGSWFAPRKEATPTYLISPWRNATGIALHAAKRLQGLGYYGLLGIDAMRYRAADGLVRWRPLQDINARWTMGRLSLGWRRLLQPREAGCWRLGLHGRSGDAIEVFREFLVAKGMRLTPERERVAQAVLQSQSRFDAEEFLARSDQSQEEWRVSRSTVYRTLGLLEEAGLVRKTLVTFPPETYEVFLISNETKRTIRTSPETVGGRAAHHQSWVLVY